MFLSHKNHGVYLDYAATTPVSPAVHAAMEPYFHEIFANPSSLHIPGQKAQNAVDEARARVAELIGASWKEAFFTPSATESINLALRGAVQTAKHRGIPNPHVITTNIEHSAVLKTIRALEAEGTEATFLPADNEGLVSAQQVKEALRENTVLVSVMYVNNEIGTVQPIKEIAKTISAYRQSRIANSNQQSAISNRPIFHTDAVQAANYLPLAVDRLGVDMMTLSGHKIYGPKGVGLLYKKEAVDLTPIVTGGEQERGLHAGTENVPAIVGFSAALEDAEELKESERQRVSALRDMLIDGVLRESETVTLNGSRRERVANNANFCFKNKSSEALLPQFDKAGIFLSGGSACTARVPEPSHVIAALGKKEEAKNAVRLSLGRHTTKKDVKKAVQVIREFAQ